MEMGKSFDVTSVKRYILGTTPYKDTSKQVEGRISLATFVQSARRNYNQNGTSNVMLKIHIRVRINVQNVSDRLIVLNITPVPPIRI